MLIELAGSGRYKLVPWPPEKQKIDIGDVYSAYSTLQTSLGWEPQVELRDGLERTIAFYREHKQQYWT
jgi:UDP-glucose 4-epimerase